MKMTQTENQIQIVNSGKQQLVAGQIAIAIGILILIGYPILNSLMAFEGGIKFGPYLIGVGVTAGLGILFLFTATTTTTVLDKSGTSSVTTKKLLKGAAKSENIPNTSINRVEYSIVQNQNRDSSNRNRTTVECSVHLIIDNTRAVEIAQASTGRSGLSFNGINIANTDMSKYPLYTEASTIAHFLGVELKLNDGSNVVAAIKTTIENIQQQMGGDDQPTNEVLQASPPQQPNSSQTSNQQPPTNLNV